MQTILLTVLLIVAIGLIGSVILVIASKALAVQEDSRLSYVRSLLPGLNCGACGYPGCDGYAKAMLSGAHCDKCNPGGARVAQELAEYLGVDAGEPAVHKAVVACHGAPDRLDSTVNYEGAPSCRAFSTMNFSSKACTFGCLGLGDCVTACPFEAISINENRVAHVNPDLCTGCGLCTTICPRHIISLQTRGLSETPEFVLCRSTMKGGAARKICGNACIGCHKCERACPEKCITVQDNLATIDVARCTGCGACAQVCPSKVIRPLSLAPVNVMPTR